MFNTKKLLLSILLLGTFLKSRADEGMWLPLFLKQLNEKEMKAQGMKLSADDIYSLNKSSLKDAIVLFGGGCTGEIISNEGLLLTNHHCGYDAIQNHSSIEHDYLKNGFWAMNKQEELPNSGLTATIIVRMEDVTKAVLEGTTRGMNEQEREKIVTANVNKIRAKAVEGTHYSSFVRPFFHGTEYYLFVTEVFKDVRLVGAPPSAIGKFGGDTDNWVWPRHTGDFSVFRIYADKDNKPAAYSKDNVPYKPKKFLTISTQGIKTNDFTMVMGFPGRTQEYLTSYALNIITQKSNPYKIALRTQRLNIIDEAMRSSDTIRIQYSAKQSDIANAWKKWSGELKGLKRLHAIEKKQALEKEFTQWANATPERAAEYGQVLPSLEKAYQTIDKIILNVDYQRDAVFAADVLAYASAYKVFADSITTTKNPERFFTIVKEQTEDFFKDYHQPTDKKLFVVCMSAYYKDIKPEYHPAIFKTVTEKFGGDFGKYADYAYANSYLVSPQKTSKLWDELRKKNVSALENDPLYSLWKSCNDHYIKNILPVYQQTAQQIELQSRLYVKGLREMQPNKKFYPDANSTLRIAYGKVKPYKPANAVTYDIQTTLDGVMEKENPNVDEFVVPAKLKELYQQKDFGRYGEKGQMPLAFIASNHTTGGNSGSPVLNARGELIGTNFDRCWEGTMSDLMYDPEQCRNITLDIRYTLFVIDKFAGAGHLIKELDIK